MQEYEGYFENGHFYPTGQTVRVIGRRKAKVTIFDEPAREKTGTWAELFKLTSEMTEDEKPRFEDFPRCQIDRPLIDFGEI